MSYENTKCPCGGHKPRETMLCIDCQIAFADTPEMRRVNDTTEAAWFRRPAAIRLLSMARRRTKTKPLPLCFHF